MQSYLRGAVDIMKTATAGYDNHVGESKVHVWSTPQHPQNYDGIHPFTGGLNGLRGTKGTSCEQGFYIYYHVSSLPHGSDPAVGRDQ
jgi:hypothetical protein